MAEPRVFRPRDLLREVQLQELAVAPDGSSVVYARRTIEDGGYRKRLWRVPWSGGRPEQLTSGDFDSRPAFSPDGSSLAFVSRRSGESRAWLLPFGGGEPRELPAPESDVALARFSPDGKRLLMLAGSGERRFAVGKPDDPVARRIESLTWKLDGTGYRDEFMSAWVVSVRGGKPRRVTPADAEAQDAFWSADGSRVGFLADLRPEAALLEWPQAWSVPAGGGDPQPLAELPGYVDAAAWSPAGTLALVGVDVPREEVPFWAEVHLFVVEDGGPRRLASDLDLPTSFLTSGDLHDPGARTPQVLWLDDEHLVSIVCDRGRSHVYRFGLDGSVDPLVRGDVVCSHIAVGGGRVAVVAGGEICALEDGRLRPLARDGRRWLGRRRLEAEPVRVPHPDGHELDAWVVRPPGRSHRPGPLVLQIHGGPHLAHGPDPWLEMLALAGAGFTVLYGNPRGSTGYGQEFTRAIAGDWGNRDASDCLRLVEWAVEEGVADPSRLGLLGLSYGGYMTNWLIGREPGRFAAAVSENPVTSLHAFFGTSDYGSWIGLQAAGVDSLAADPARIADRSPLTEIHRNEAPLLLLQAEGDLRCPPEQSDLVFVTLRRLGRPVELVRYPRESHLLLAIGRPDRRVDRLERIVGWFEHHL